MSNMNHIAISVKNVSKSFLLPHQRVSSVKSGVLNIFNKNGKNEVQKTLKDVSFEVKKGEFFGIVGRNGSGKSTMLKMLAQIYQPTSGEIHIDGKLVPFIELGVGFNPELTGRENVYLNGALLGFSRKEIDERYDEIVEFAELENFMDQKLKNYSSGMQVRLAFSVATRAEADILLVDEVLAVGDADFQRKCFNYFKSLKKNKKTVVFVTHSMDAVKDYCDKAILINKGEIVASGRADKVADEYTKLFLNVSSTDNKEGRWGDQKAVIKDFVTEMTDKNIKIKATIHANEDIEELVFGYRFKDAEERLVMGGNNLNASGSRKISMKKSETRLITFTIPNILGNGSFNVSATLRLADGISICDNWEDIMAFNNSRTEGHYPIVAPSSMEIK